MLTYITHPVVCSWLEKVCQLMSPKGVFDLSHSKVCWLTSPTQLSILVFKKVCRLRVLKGVFELSYPKVCRLTSPTLLSVLDLKNICWLRLPTQLSAVILKSIPTYIIAFELFFFSSSKLCWLRSSRQCLFFPILILITIWVSCKVCRLILPIVFSACDISNYADLP